MNEAIRPGPENPPHAIATPQLSVIVPTFNERDNVTTLFRRLEKTLAGLAWEVIFVDDNSPDGTWDVVRGLARQDLRVRCVRRVGRRGLSGACIEGILASSAPCVAVIDADLQHDETQLPKMLALLQSGEAELVVGSRYIEGGSADSFNKQRAGASALATEVAKRVLRVKIADPMSGFFMIRRDRFEQLAPQLSTQGFKILLDVVATARGNLRVREIPYVFRPRLHGQSKLDSQVVLEYAGLLIAKASGDLISTRFLAFGLVGSVGVIVHLFVLRALLPLGMPFAMDQTAAMYIAMAFNYSLNNAFTYRDQRRRGWRFLTGFAMFAALCSFGVVGGVGVSSLLYTSDSRWWVAGLASAVVGVAWNYIANSAITWRPR